MEQQGVSWVRHYVDDFVTVGPPASPACGHNMEIMQETCEKAGMPIEPDKNEGPSQVITFLGLELDTNHLNIRLPSNKLMKLKALVCICMDGQKSLQEEGAAVTVGAAHTRGTSGKTWSVLRENAYWAVNKD